MPCIIVNTLQITKPWSTVEDFSQTLGQNVHFVTATSPEFAKVHARFRDRGNIAVTL
jgi:hypothetical protein